jgi:hypothetical protein
MHYWSTDFYISSNYGRIASSTNDHNLQQINGQFL